MIADAIALFVRNEAALLTQVTETNKALVEGERRFARIEGDLEQIKTMLRQLTAAVDRHEQILTRHEQILNRHERILVDLPEAIRQKIGFKSKS